jgi:hypothetical protein
MLEALSEQRLRAALKPQCERRIRVRPAFFQNCDDLATHNKINDLDFGLFDSFAVSFFRTGHGRGYTITTNGDEIKDYTDLYKDITTRCEMVPGKRTGDDTLFLTEDDFNRWLKFQA